MLEAVYAGWRHDTLADKTRLMMAHSDTIVTELSDRAHADRIAVGEVRAGGVAPQRLDRRARGLGRHPRQQLQAQVQRRQGLHPQRPDRHTHLRRRVIEGQIPRHPRHHDPPRRVRRRTRRTRLRRHCPPLPGHDRRHRPPAPDRRPDPRRPLRRRHPRRRNHHALRRHPHRTPRRPRPPPRPPQVDPDATAAREIAEQILAKEPDNRTATMEREHQRERAASLATLVPMYRTATERAAEHHYDALIDRVGGTLLHLLRPHYPEAHLDTDTALTPAPVNAPANSRSLPNTKSSSRRQGPSAAGSRTGSSTSSAPATTLPSRRRSSATSFGPLSPRPGSAVAGRRGNFATRSSRSCPIQAPQRS